MKKTVGYIFKIIIAGIISVVILSLFSLLYYNPPLATQQPESITNYKFVPKRHWSYMLEGFGFGITDDFGYNNAYYQNLENPDIVFVGSSHMEAQQVPQDANCVYLLNKMFDSDEIFDNDYKCLNIGISGHFFEMTSSNIKYIAKKFENAKYLIVEMSDVKYPISILDGIIKEEYHAPLEKNGYIKELAQKIPYVRLLYKKINETTSADSDISQEEIEAINNDFDIDVYTDKINIILKKISLMCEENNIKPIILMHERFWEDAERNIVKELDETYKNTFVKCCKTNGIMVIDASYPMIEAYKNNYEFSYGFSNTTPGEGHLNKTGHKIIAETIYEKINEMEEMK